MGSWGVTMRQSDYGLDLLGTIVDAGVALSVTIGIHLVLQHLLLGDVVRHKPFGGTLGTQLSQVVVWCARFDVVLLQNIDELGEGGRNPDTLPFFVIFSLDSVLPSYTTPPLLSAGPS